LFSPEIFSCNPVVVTPRLEATASNLRTAVLAQDGSLLRDASDYVVDADPLANANPLPQALVAPQIEIQVGGIPQSFVVEQYDISWPPEKKAVSYRIYGSLSPLGITNLLATVAAPLTEYVFTPPMFGGTVEYYFWVSYVDSVGTETYLTNTPATLMAESARKNLEANPISYDPTFYPDPDCLNREMALHLEIARKAARLELENDGEDAYLYSARAIGDRPWSMPCVCSRSGGRGNMDPGYQGRGNCTLCFGTGVYGGFYPKMSIRFRYSNIVTKGWDQQAWGRVNTSKINQSFTLWAPIIKKGDLLVRKSTGERFVFNESPGRSVIRGVLIRQVFDLAAIEDKSVLNEVTDVAIEQSLASLNLPGFLRDGYKIFG
jgi:hypothetical protein